MKVIYNQETKRFSSQPESSVTVYVVKGDDGVEKAHKSTNSNIRVGDNTRYGEVIKVLGSSLAESKAIDLVEEFNSARGFSKDNESKDYAVVYLKINPDYKGTDKGDLESGHYIVKNGEAEVGNFSPKSTKAYIIDRVIKKNLTQEDARQLVEANRAQYPR